MQALFIFVCCKLFICVPPPFSPIGSTVEQFSRHLWWAAADVHRSGGSWICQGHTRKHAQHSGHWSVHGRGQTSVDCSYSWEPTLLLSRWDQHEGFWIFFYPTMILFFVLISACFPACCLRVPEYSAASRPASHPSTSAPAEGAAHLFWDPEQHLFNNQDQLHGAVLFTKFIITGFLSSTKFSIPVCESTETY